MIKAAAINNCSSNPILTRDCTELYAFSVALGVVSSLTISIYLLAFTFARDKLHEKSMMYLSGEFLLKIFSFIFNIRC